MEPGLRQAPSGSLDSRLARCHSCFTSKLSKNVAARAADAGHKLPGPPIGNRIRRLANGQRPTRQCTSSLETAALPASGHSWWRSTDEPLVRTAPSVETRNITAWLGRVNSRVREDSTP